MKGLHEWASLATVICVRRVISTKTGSVVSSDDRYSFSSLAADRLSAAKWVFATRSRWAVENQGHHTLDATFSEDKGPWIVADPRGLLAVLLLRRMAYNLLALFRAVTQRSDDNRKAKWRDLLDNFAHALVTATTEQLRGLDAPLVHAR